MSNLKSKILILILLATITIVVIWLTLNDSRTHEDIDTNETTNITVYLQDKNAVLYDDCGITYPKEILIPRTTAVADMSLTYLFENELSQYGNYESVVITDGVAQITLSNQDDPTGLKISSLSSCESRHLFAVLQDTLMQYETIISIELHSPSGKIDF